MSAERFYIQENGAGGYQAIDRRTGKTVTSSTFYEFCDKAVSRLMGYTNWTKEEAFEFYKVQR